MADETPSSEPTAEQVLAWMATTRRGPKAAASHFGLSVNTVKSWVRRARERQPEGKVIRLAPPATPATPPSSPPPGEDETPAVDPVAETPLEYYSRKLREADALVRQAKPRDAASLLKQASTLRDRVDRLQAEEEARRKRAGGATSAIGRIETAIENGDFPDAVVDRIEAAIARRRRVPAA